MVFDLHADLDLPTSWAMWPASAVMAVLPFYCMVAIITNVFSQRKLPVPSVRQVLMLWCVRALSTLPTYAYFVVFVFVVALIGDFIHRDVVIESVFITKTDAVSGVVSKENKPVVIKENSWFWWAASKVVRLSPPVRSGPQFVRPSYGGVDIDDPKLTSAERGVWAAEELPNQVPKEYFIWLKRDGYKLFTDLNKSVVTQRDLSEFAHKHPKPHVKSADPNPRWAAKIAKALRARSYNAVPPPVGTGNEGVVNSKLPVRVAQIDGSMERVTYNVGSLAESCTAQLLRVNGHYITTAHCLNGTRNVAEDAQPTWIKAGEGFGFVAEFPDGRKLKFKIGRFFGFDLVSLIFEKDPGMKSMRCGILPVNVRTCAVAYKREHGLEVAEGEIIGTENHTCTTQAGDSGAAVFVGGVLSYVHLGVDPTGTVNRCQVLRPFIEALSGKGDNEAMLPKNDHSFYNLPGLAVFVQHDHVRTWEYLGGMGLWLNSTTGRRISFPTVHGRTVCLPSFSLCISLARTRLK
jgi:hypothetical protein